MSIVEDKLGHLVASAMEEPKSPVGAFTLPGGVFLNGTTYKDIVLKEITGHEEDLIGNPKIAPEVKLEQLIRQVITNIGPFEDRAIINEAVSTMLTGDRAFVIISLRRLSLGDVYDFVAECPNCKYKELVSTNLADLTVKEAVGDRVQEMTCPSGKKVVWHFMTGFDEARNNTLKDKEKDLLSIGITARVDAINGTPSNMAMVKGLSTRDREALRTEFERCEPGVDMKLELVCTKCGFEHDRDMDIDIGFFFPSQVQKTWKRKS